MKGSIFKAGKKYTFSDYFDFNYPTEEIVAEFGYSYILQVITLPESTRHNKAPIEALKETYYKILPQITLTSEMAKREFLIAPLIFELAKETDSKIYIEYPLDIDDKLSGLLDYLIRARQELLVIEAKKGDIDKGFNQLAAELIALDKYEDNSQPLLYGAITIGDMWRFGILDRQKKLLIKDIHSYRVPEDMAQVFGILLGIVTRSNLVE